MSRDELIAYYENNLIKVKLMHNPERETTCLMKEKCMSFIKSAEMDLEAVKNGRNW